MKSVFYDTLKDGTPILMRLVQPEDRKKLVEGFARLSPQSKKFRFAVPLCRLRPDQLAYLTEIDNENHVAYGVLDLSLPDKPGIGIGRYVRLEGDSSCAEIAVTVIDDYQNKGLGTKLIQALAQAARNFGITRFCAYVLEENRGMMTLLKKLGAAETRESAVLFRVEFPVNAACPVNSP